jgi:excisionase family DNA binding protein
MKNNAAFSPKQSSSHATSGPRVASMDFQQLPFVLTSREAANVLRVGVREVRTLVDSGQLAGTRLGPRKVIRISRAALLALMRVQSTG